MHNGGYNSVSFVLIGSEIMDRELQDAMLIAQLRQKHELKEQCLHAAEENSPLHSEAEKLLSMSKLVDGDSDPAAFTALLKKEQKFLDSIITEMRTSLGSMPEAMLESAAGKFAKNSLMLTVGALHRLQEAEKAESAKTLTIQLEEAAFLLEGADGRA
jgi:hypothetical protein